jgi:hypothetical protein
MTARLHDNPSSLAALPDMTIPFSSVCHDDIDRLEQQALEWGGQYAPGTMMSLLKKTRAGRIVARTASLAASPDLLRAYGKMLVWGFWFDDRFIDDAPADSPDLMPAIASMLRILDADQGKGAAGRPMEAAFTDVISDLQQVLSGAQYSLWQIEMRLWFTSMCLQNVLRISTKPPSPDTYKTVRLYTVCSFPCIVLIDASHPITVNWDTYQHPDLARLRRHAANIVAWQNDVFSFFAEQRHPGKFWNLPSVYATRGHTAEESIKLTARDVAAELRAYQQEEAALQTVTTQQSAHLQSLRQWMRGCRDWSLETRERYFGWQPPDPAATQGCVKVS